MSFYVYAFLSLPASSLILPEGMKQKVELIGSEKLAVLVEPDISIEAIQKTDEQLLQAVLTHDRVVREVFEQTSLLPLRFGNAFDTVENIITHLQQYQEQYLATLSKLENQVEYTVSFSAISAPASLEVTDARGKAYLLAKKKRFQEQQAFQTQQHQQWENICQLILQEYPKAVCKNSIEGNVKQVHLLTNREAKILITQQLPTWQSNCSYWQVTLSQPLPPYHFV